jgi:hypothetical protein
MVFVQCLTWKCVILIVFFFYYVLFVAVVEDRKMNV